MPRNLFTDDEIILCTYIAVFGRSDFDEAKVVLIRKRSSASIVMKVQNIAAMLREERYRCHPSISSLTGLPAGQKGRRTNWDVVQKLPLTNQDNFRAICNSVLRKYSMQPTQQGQ